MVYIITFYLQFLCDAAYLKRSNDAPKLNMHKYNNFNINVHKEIKYYNVDFHSDGLLDPDVRKVRSFYKTTKACAKELFSHPVETTGSMYFGNIFRIMRSTFIL